MNDLLFIPLIHADNLLYETTYSPALVITSVLIAVFAAYVATVSWRVSESATGWSVAIWGGVSAITLGVGVWAMHFIGMLSLSLPCGINYDPHTTFVSIIPGIFGSGVAMFLAGKQRGGQPWLLLGSIAMGAGIGSMHYLGMAAMHFDGLLRYDPALFGLSVFVAIGLSFIALRARLAVKHADRKSDWMIAAIIGAAVSGMHYTAMLAAHFVRGDVSVETHTTISVNVLAIAIVSVSLIMSFLILALSSAARSRAIAKQLQESEMRWKFALEGAGDGVWDWNIETGATFFSTHWKEIIGYADDEFENHFEAWLDVLHPEDKARVEAALGDYFAGNTPTYHVEFRMRCKDGSYKWILSRGTLIRRDGRGKPLRMIGTHADISEKKRTEEMIWRQANFDTLTGLPNRRMFRDRLTQEMKKSQRAGQPLALMFIDLDRFKEVNDTLGHDVGDALLVEAAKRISACVRTSDTVARLGGDEFTIIVSDFGELTSVDLIAQKVIDRLQGAFVLADNDAFISASIGITLYPNDAEAIEALLKNADQAMYAAKEQGRNRYSYFTSALQEAAIHRMKLTADLRLALEAQQFELHYQPIVEMASGAIYKAEALIRWHHPQRGLVSPAQFIPLAEETGLIKEIGEWVFHQAVSQLTLWRKKHPNFQVSVNKSPVQFREKRNDRAWVDHLHEQGLSGQAIVVEITEGLLLDVSDTVRNKLLIYRDAGIQVSLDDFGTGYSSLSYLQKFDIDYLKIDQSFVRNLEEDVNNAGLCEAIIVMAHTLGIKVIAEGVETEAQRRILLAAGCDYGQGYLFSKPVAAEAFERLL